MKGYAVKNGGLHLTKFPEVQLKSQHVIIKNLVAGINYHDIDSLGSVNFESGKKLLGFEGVGIIEDVDSKCIKEFKQGQRVCYTTAFGVGAFCEKVSIHEDCVVHVPDGIPNDYAATVFKALAAHMLLFRSYTLKKNDLLGVTSPSGGVASYLTQWATSLGVKVIGLLSSSVHKAIATENGCVAAFSYKEQQRFISQAEKLSSLGLGLNVFYDSVGLKSYAVGIKSLMPFGLYMHYGALSGELKGISARHFQRKALFFTTPSTFYSKANPVELTLTLRMIFENMQNSILRPNIHRYKFSHLQKAFDDIKNGTPGHKILIIKD